MKTTQKGSIRALSVQYPHCASILDGTKNAEYRTWTTSHRGPLVIVSSAKPDRDICGQEGLRPTKADLGVLYCLVDLVDIQGDPKNGDVAWMLENPQPIERVPYKGRLGLYSVPADIVKVIGAAKAKTPEELAAEILDIEGKLRETQAAMELAKRQSRPGEAFRLSCVEEDLRKQLTKLRR